MVTDMDELSQKPSNKSEVGKAAFQDLTNEHGEQDEEEMGKDDNTGLVATEKEENSISLSSENDNIKDSSGHVDPKDKANHNCFRSSQLTLAMDSKNGNGSMDSGTGSISREEAGSATDRDSRQSSGFGQILALLRKNLLTKYRTPVGTFFELFSPLLMMLVLVAAYTITDVTYEEARVYSGISVDVPGPWLGLLQRSTGLFTATQDPEFSSRRALRREPNLLEFKMEETVDETGWTGIFSGLQEMMHRKMMGSVMGNQDEKSRKLYHDERGEESDDSDDEFADIYQLLDDARKEISSVLQSPIPVPSFDQYVGTSLALSTLIGVDNLPRVFSGSTFGRQWGNLLTLGTIHLSPKNDVTESFWEYLNETYPILLDSSVKVRIHDNENDAVRFIDDNLDERTWALLDFSRYSPAEEESRFKIRMNFTTVPNTNEITNYVSIGLNKDYQMYYLSGYLTLQRTINEFAFSQADGCGDALDDLSSLWSMPMPTAAYSQNPFFLQVGYLLGLTMVMAFLYPTSRLIKTIVEEKENRMKETLFILGVRGWAHWFSWFITSLCVFFIITTTVTAALTSAVLNYSDPAYIFMYIGLFSTATIGFCFTLAALFSRAKLAAIIGPVALFGTILPRFIFFGSNRYEATTGKIIASLFPATAFTFAADIIADYEYSQQGIQEWNAGEGDYSFNTALGLLFFDTLLYIFLGWYLDQVVPQQYGVARPFYFIFMPSYWCGSLISSNENNSPTGAIANLSESSASIELVTDTSLLPRVQIKNLVKRYNKASSYPPAVDNLNLTMYESQITALLGHNGAGKTTMVSVLTGLFPPSAGDCILYGKSIVHNLQEARQSIGICPQHNVLFDCLTVYEHLALFMRIKGIRPEESIVRTQADEIGLTDYIRTTSLALSGGNKRKLSVAIALSGNPSVLVLDEPTSGMDPYSRRAVWELLRAKRKGRVTLLTTHFMDEAELLSDRIAVLKEGKLQCCGSALFLKERFGLGYNLTVVLEPPRTSIDEEIGDQNLSEEMSQRFPFAGQRDRLTGFLRQRIPNTELVRSSGKEVTFRFPQGSENLFPAAFDALEVERESLGIGAYGVQNCSLEEVFLQLAEDENDFNVGENPPGFEGEETGPGADSASSNEHQLTNPVEEKSEENSDVERGEYRHISPLRQIGLLYMKRLMIQKRDLKGAFFTIILPVLVIALVLLILMVEPPFVGPAIEVNPSLYKKSSVGLDGETGVVVGGGSSVARNSSAEMEYALMSESIHQHYKFTDFSYIGNATTSADVSRYLLSTYNKNDHLVRFGAYALDDIINVTISMNWDEIKDAMNGLSGNGATNMDLIEAFELGGANGKMIWNVSVADLADTLYNLSMISPDIAFDAMHLQALTRAALDMIFASRSNANSSRSSEEWLESLNALVGTVVVEILLAGGTTNWTAHLEDLATELIDLVQNSLGTNSTVGDLSQWAGGWIGEVKDEVNCVYASLYELMQWADETFDDVNEFLLSNPTTDVFRNWVADLYNNITEAIGRECIAVNNGQEWADWNLTKFETELILLLQDTFGTNVTAEDLSQLSSGWIDDLKGRINSTNATLYELMQWVAAIFEDVNELTGSNTTVGDLSSWVIDLFNKVTDSAVNKIANETGLNLTKLVEYVHDFVKEEGSFERESLVQAIEELIDGAMGSLSFDSTVNSSALVTSVFELLDSRYVQLEGDLSPVELSNTMALSSIVVVDSVLRELIIQYGENMTLKMEEVFSYLSEVLGGSSSQLDGFFSIELSAASLNLAPPSMSLSGLRVQIANEVIFDLGDTPWNLTIDSLLSLLSNHTAEYTFPLDSKASILHNSSSPHAAAAFNQAYMEYLFATCKKSRTARLISVNEPLPMTTQQSIEVQTILSILAALFLLIPFCYIPGAFIVFIVKERVSKSKHLQLVSGVNMTSYWTATYLWDLSLFSVLTICVMLVFLMYGSESAKVFVGDFESFFASMALTFGYGMSILPFSYLLARNFDNPSSAQISVIGLIFLTGFVAVNAYFIMSTIETTEDVADSLRPLFRLWPAYNIGEGFINLASAFWEREVLFSEKRPFDWDVTGKSIALLYGLAPVYFLILLFLEYSHDGGSGGVVGRMLRHIRGSCDRMMLRFHGVKRVDNQLCLDDGLVEARANEDIITEEAFVRNDNRLQMFAPVVMRDLWKVYPPSVGVIGALCASLRWIICCCGLVCTRSESSDDRALPRRAVRGLTVAVQKGETFGLLGANGAGKTTTLGILTGDIAPTSGDAYVAGNDITGSVPGGVAEARKNIGFCPQTDPLLDLMTGRETLQMFAKLRGVPFERIDRVVDDLLDRLTLTPHADKTSESYSGGNKRKLSLGVAALVGDGGVLLVDECSSGLDPLARKKLWSLIENLAVERSVIITTHSMEEAEALCTRIGIMAKGRLVALGPVQHLKTKYLDGYTIDLNCHSNTPEHIIDAVVADVLETVVPGSKLSERHGRFLKFDVRKVSAIGLGATFQRLQELKESGNFVENYSISQCSLEQVFIKLVQDAENPEGVEEERTVDSDA